MQSAGAGCGAGRALCGLRRAARCRQCESAARSGAASASASTGAEEKAPRTELNGVHLRDNPELYTVYDDSGVVTMYLTVSRGNDSENTNHSWAEINHYSVYDYEAMGVPRYQVNALLQVGDENGPLPGELGYGVEAPTPRCRSAARPPAGTPRKTIRSSSKRTRGSWRDQRTIALNKHMGEGLRFRNKMAYDLIKGHRPDDGTADPICPSLCERSDRQLQRCF